VASKTSATRALLWRPLQPRSPFLAYERFFLPDGLIGLVRAEHKAPVVAVDSAAPAGLKEAQRQGKPIFIDFTGYTCTNCRWMEANMFLRPEIRAELGKFVLVRFFTDREGQPYQGKQQMEMDRFDSVALPLYAILTPSGEIKASFPGLTRDPNEFLRFLNMND
jgi:thiol:disulfide interchange protein